MTPNYIVSDQLSLLPVSAAFYRLSEYRLNVVSVHPYLLVNCKSTKFDCSLCMGVRSYDANIQFYYYTFDIKLMTQG